MFRQIWALMWQVFLPGGSEITACHFNTTVKRWSYVATVGPPYTSYVIVFMLWLTIEVSNTCEKQPVKTGLLFYGTPCIAGFLYDIPVMNGIYEDLILALTSKIAP